VHVVAGLEKRAVIVDSGLADRKRTVACTRWSPIDGAAADPPFLIVTDSTEHGLPAATPYLTFHHAVPAKQLSKGSWMVELLLGEVLDDWSEAARRMKPADDAARSRQEKFVAACLKEEPVFRDTFEVR
jgi:hypothetical protein